MLAPMNQCMLCVKGSVEKNKTTTTKKTQAKNKIK